MLNRFWSWLSADGGRLIFHYQNELNSSIVPLSIPKKYFHGYRILKMPTYGSKSAIELSVLIVFDSIYRLTCCTFLSLFHTKHQNPKLFLIVRLKFVFQIIYRYRPSRRANIFHIKLYGQFVGSLRVIWAIWIISPQFCLFS